MKIVSLQAENIKRLVAVEITPSGNMVQITGKNGQGKTSVLDAIWWALVGGRNIQAMPIRAGAESAFIKLDLGKLKVTRTFKRREGDETTTDLKVETADGARFSSAQATLDAVIGELTFDPLAFSRMKAQDQFDALRRFVPDFDFAENAQQRKKIFDERTYVNREAKNLQAQADGIVIGDDVPAERADKTELLATLDKAHQANADIEVERAARAAASRNLDAAQTLLAEMEERHQRMLEEAAKLESAIKLHKGMMDANRERLHSLPPLPEAIDTATIRGLIARADEVNEKVAQREQRDKIRGSAKAMVGLSEKLTAQIDALDEQKAKAIAEAKMPIPGLSFGDGMVMLNGVPFDQASDAEQLRASIAIAGAMNPELRVIRVRDGSLLDDEAMQLLSAYADENDLQVWIERVDSSGSVGFVIEDGMLKAAETPAEAAE